MTKLEIVQEVADRLNYTSTTALARLDRAVDRLYRAVTSTIGLNVTRQVDVVVSTVQGSRDLIVPTVEKVTAIRFDNGFQLKELDYEELRSRHAGGSGRPTAYAVRRMNATTVVVTFDLVPNDAYALNVSGYTTLATLADGDEPAFPESYHDILIEGILKDEYRKLEKMNLAAASKALYDERLRELRLWIAKSAYQELYQGKLASDRRDSLGTGGGGSSPLLLPAWHVGSGAPAASLGRLGDFYLDADTGDVYEKTSTTVWTLVANIEGPTGPQGPQGATGATGPTGPAGPVDVEGAPTAGNLAEWFDATTIEDSGIATADVATTAQVSPREAVFVPAANNPPSSGAATIDERNAHPILVFPDAVVSSAIFPGILPVSYGGNDIRVTIVWASPATTGDAVWAAAWERLADGVQDIDADGFAANQTAVGSTRATSGVLRYTTIDFTSAQIDGLLAGEAYRLRVQRLGDNGSDDLTDVAQVLRVGVRELV